MTLLLLEIEFLFYFSVRFFFKEKGVRRKIVFETHLWFSILFLDYSKIKLN